MSAGLWAPELAGWLVAQSEWWTAARWAEPSAQEKAAPLVGQLVAKSACCLVVGWAVQLDKHWVAPMAAWWECSWETLPAATWAESWVEPLVEPLDLAWAARSAGQKVDLLGTPKAVLLARWWAGWKVAQ